MTTELDAGSEIPDAGSRQSGIALVITAAGTWLLMLWLTLTQGFSPLSSGQLPDTDDYMRLLQVRRWIDGASWFDFSQPRVDPPFGLEMHWSRLPDLPLALATLATEQFFNTGTGRETALYFAAALVPTLLFLGFLFAVGWAAKPLAGAVAAPLAVIATGLSYPLLYQFQPGRVDHHAYQLLFAALALGLLLRLWRRPESIGLQIASGIVFAAGLWNSGEMIPWLALFGAVLAAGWIFWGRAWAEAGLGFTASLFAFSLTLLLLTRRPGMWLTPYCDAFSIVHVIMVALALLVFAGLAFNRHFSRTPGLRILTAAIAGLAAVTALTLLYPQCRVDYSAGLDAEFVRVWLDTISEAQPLTVAFAGGPGMAVLYLGGPLLAVGLGLWRVTKETGHRRARLLIVLVWLVASLALTFWQIPVVTFAVLFGVFLLTEFFGWWLWGEASQTAAARHGGVNWRRLAGFAALLVVLPGVGLIAPVYAELNSGTGGTPAEQSSPADKCRVDRVATWLGDPAGLGLRPLLVSARNDYGPVILYHSPHQVLAAPYHRNVRGVLDSHHILAASAPEAARAIARKRQVDLILLCQADRNFFSNYRTHDQPVLAERLLDGETFSWLLPIALPESLADETGARLFRVLP